MDHRNEDNINEMEDDVTEGHSGAGSIVPVMGQIDGVLAEYPNDATTTVTEAIQGSVEYAWIDEFDNESEANSSTVGVSPTHADNKRPTAGVCETIAPSWAQVVVKQSVSPCSSEPNPLSVSQCPVEPHSSSVSQSSSSPCASEPHC